MKLSVNKLANVNFMMSHVPSPFCAWSLHIDLKYTKTKSQQVHSHQQRA